MSQKISLNEEMLWCASYGDLNGVIKMIRKGADPYYISKDDMGLSDHGDGFDILLFLALNARASAVLYLAEKYPKLLKRRAKMLHKRTAGLWLAVYGQTEIAFELSKIDPDILLDQDEQGLSIGLCAAYLSEFDIALEMARERPEIMEHKMENGDTILHIFQAKNASQDQIDELLRIMRRARIDIPEEFQ